MDEPNNDVVMEDTMLHDMPDMGKFKKTSRYKPMIWDLIRRNLICIETSEGISGVSGPAVVPTLFEDQPTVNSTVEQVQEPAQKIPEDKEESLNSGSNVEVPKGSQEASADDTLIEAIPTETGESLPELLGKGNEPVPAIEKQIRSKRRRKLLIDEVKEIDSNTMKNQLSDTSAIVAPNELAPPTRRLMLLKETGCLEKLFSSTSRPLFPKMLHKVNKTSEKNWALFYKSD